jgi:hypothetical protein
MPLGNPMVLNNTIVAGATQTTTANNNPNRSVAPWTIRQPAAPVQATPVRDKLKGFRVRKWCKICGCRNKDHVEAVEGKPNKTCKRNFCGRCMQRKEFHPHGKMGPHCELPISPNSDYANWYKKSS